MKRGPGMQALGRSATAGTMVVVLGAISACTPTYLLSGEREKLCRVAVEERFDALDVQPNLAAQPAGGALVGAGSAGLIALGIVTLNPLAVIQGAAGAAAGMACVAGGAAHPHAEPDFRRIAVTADRGAVKRALEAELAVQRPACPNMPPGTVPVPDAVVQLTSVVLTMGCPGGQQAYYVTVKWRATSASGDKALAESTMRCQQVSSESVDAWAADPARARAEVNDALARTGQRVAAELLGDKRMPCTFEPEAPKESGPR